MKPYIYGARTGIYIIDLQQTAKLLRRTYAYVRSVAAEGQPILFVGTKRQAQASISEQADRCGMPYVNHRWLGGMMTNFQTVKNSVDRLKAIEAMQEDGSIQHLVKKEILPNIDDWEEQGEFPLDLYRQAGEVGILGIGYPEEYGGTPGDIFFKIAAKTPSQHPALM